MNSCKAITSVRAVLFFGLFFSLIFNLVVASADDYDDKARAAAQQQQRIDTAKAYEKALATVNKENQDVLNRVPRQATNVSCFDREANIYRNMANGCRLGNSEWNGIPVQICERSWGRSAEYPMPPEIVSCHYKIAPNLDCKIVKNPSYKPTCY